MALFKRKSSPEPAAVPASTEGLLGETRQLTREWQERPERETERRLLQLRHLAGVRLVDAAEPSPGYAAPDESALPALSLIHI